MSDKEYKPHMSDNHRAQAGTGLNAKKVLVVLGLMVVAFAGAYNFALAKDQTSAAAGSSAVASTSAGVASGASTGGGGGCCGGGGASVSGSAKVSGGVQKIDVDTSQGSFNPNVIKVKAGVPIEMTFSKSGGGCLSGVFFPDFNINEDLTSGPKTVKIPALKKGQYTFYCQMQMVSATIVAE